MHRLHVRYIGSMLQQLVWVEHVSSPVSLDDTLVEKDAYLTYLDDQWTPTGNSQIMS